MTTGESSPRIGTAERTAAMRALDEHLNAGRLQVEEYADRSAIAANAGTAFELAALFTDLPAPHPELPGVPGVARDGAARRPAVVWSALFVVVVLAVGGLFLVFATRDRSGAAGPRRLLSSHQRASRPRPLRHQSNRRQPKGPPNRPRPRRARRPLRL
jgi:hypothetical protein